MASTAVMPPADKEHARRFSLESIKGAAPAPGGSPKKKKKNKGPKTGRRSSATAKDGPIGLQSPSKVVKPAFVIVPSASDRFPSYDVDVGKAKGMEVSEATWKQAMDTALLLGKDSRYILAHGLIGKLEAFAASGAAPGTKAAIEAEMQQGANATLWARIKERGQACSAALAPPSEDAGWIFAQSLFGMDTYYKYTEGKLYCKVEGAFTDCAVLDQLAVIREGDLWNKWAPFVSKSTTLRRFSPPGADMACHFTLNMPLMTRDCVMRGYACDNMEDHIILLMGDSVEDLEGDPVPPKPTGWVVDRMDIKNFQCKITCKGPTAGHVVLSAILDPKTNLPEALVNFATKQLVGVLIYLLQEREASRKITSDPAKNHHAKKIREQSDFYRHWLLPRARLYSQMHGWAPLPMAALEGFEPATPGLTPDSHGVTPASASTAAAAPAPTAAGAVSSQAQPQQQALMNSTGALVPSGNEKAKAKKKKLKFSSLFRRKQKNEEPAPASQPPPTVAQRVVEAILSPVRLLSPAAVRSPGKSTRSPYTTRGGSPYRRANAPWTFALIVASFFALKASTLAIFTRAHFGVVGEAVFLTALMQVVLQLAAVYGFFEAQYVGRIFDDRLQLTLPSARLALALISGLGSGIGAVAALSRVYHVEIIISRRPDAPAGEWARAASAVAQWWSTAVMACLVVVVVRPDLARKLVRYPHALLQDK